MKIGSRVFGSIFIIAGTAIGAGMLALPIVTGALGFRCSIVLLALCWAAMTLTAFLILHVNMAFGEHSNFSSMAKHTIGRFGFALTWICCLGLLYALTAAYMTGGAALIGHSFRDVFHIHAWPKANAVLFTLVLGSFVYFGTRSVDYATRLFLSLKICAFLLMVILLFPYIRVENLALSSREKLGWLIALPIVMTSFGFHNVIPSLRDYLHSDVKRLRRILWVGSLGLLLIYFLWELAVLGTASDLNNKAGIVGLFATLASHLHQPALSFAVNFFADIAVSTSFLGVSMSLFHFVRDGFSLNRGRSGEKLLAAFVTFIPPLCFAWFYPEGFVLALNYASIFVVVLLILIPVWMTIMLKRKGKKSAYPFRLHWIGSLFLLGFSALVIAAQFI